LLSLPLLELRERGGNTTLPVIGASSSLVSLFVDEFQPLTNVAQSLLSWGKSGRSEQSDDQRVE
jgi:hypothetical protein